MDHDPDVVECFLDLAQLVAVLDLGSVEPAPPSHHAEAVVRLDTNIRALTAVRDRHARELLTATRAMPKGPVTLDSIDGPLTVKRARDRAARGGRPTSSWRSCTG